MEKTVGQEALEKLKEKGGVISENTARTLENGVSVGMSDEELERRIASGQIKSRAVKDEEPVEETEEKLESEEA